MSKMSMLYTQFLFTTVNFTILICNNSITRLTEYAPKLSDLRRS